MTDASSCTDSVFEADVIDSSVIDEGVFQRLLRRAGRTIAAPALEALEMLLDQTTPAQARLTMLAALTYLLIPTDLIPDFVPVAGFSDDLVTLTAAVATVALFIDDAVKAKAAARVATWFGSTAHETQ